MENEVDSGQPWTKGRKIVNVIEDECDSQSDEQDANCTSTDGEDSGDYSGDNFSSDSDSESDFTDI